MRQLLPTSARAVAALSLFSLMAVNSWMLRAQEPAAQEQASPYATSNPFDLEPRVERATLDLRRPNVRALYDAIAQAYGIRLIFDREVTAELPLSNFRVEDATLPEALDAAASISRTFVAPLDTHTGIVTTDTPDKRTQYERQLLTSFRMDAQTTPQQLTEISTALRNLLDLRRVTQDSDGWITAAGRKRQVQAATEFVRTFQKPSGEVMLEVEVWEVDSSRMRQLGIQPPQAAQLVYLGYSAATDAAGFLTFGMGRTLYGLTVAGLTAFLSSNNSVVKTHQVFHVRADDGLPANLLGGERVPVVTTLFSAGVVEEGSPNTPDAGEAEGFIPTIQYQDTGVTIHATPHFHAGRELTLQLEFALRTVGARDQNGLPTFGQREVTGQVRLKDGESFLISGMLSSNETKSVSGTPGLSYIPFLGALFSKRDQQKDERELIIKVRPTILRFAPAEEVASRTIFFGRELSGLPAPLEEAPPPQIFPGGPPPVPAPIPGVLPGAVPGAPGFVPQPVPGIPGTIQQPAPAAQPRQFEGSPVPPPSNQPGGPVEILPGAPQSVPQQPQPEGRPLP